MDSAEQVLRDNREFYRACAPEYDAGREYGFRRDRFRVQADLRRIGLEGAAVLDIGCGTGFYSLMAADAGAGELHCLDIDPVFLEAAKTKVQAVHPQLAVHCHEGDLGSFIRERVELLSGIDICVMGSVLQYVPDHEAVLGQMAQRAKSTCFYITSTPLPGGGKHRHFDGWFARLDYALHRVIHPGVRGRRHRLSVKATTLEVDPERLREVLSSQGFNVKYYSYSSFHTLLFSQLHRFLCRIFPSLGAQFTLIAVGHKENRVSGGG